MTKLLQYVEVDADYCSRTYGAGACLARTQLVTNGTFNSTIAGWTAGAGTVTAAWTTGRLRLTHSGTNYASYKQAITTVVGQTYEFSGDIVSAASLARIIKSDSASDISVQQVVLLTGNAVAASGSATFVATATTTYIHCVVGTTGVHQFDNISVIVGISTKKCFNSLNTCQDRAHFNNVPVTLRFAVDTGYNPDDIEAIPSVKGINVSPSRISLGGDLGIRSSVEITFTDHPHSDTGAGFDKYLADRSYDPYTQGTFWGKFRNRQRFLRGRPLRLIRGQLGQVLTAMETRHYVVDAFDGPRPDGTFTIIAKDMLKLADSARAVAPAPSTGSLNAAITGGATSAVLTPAGVGNSEYPASGFLNIGGKEIVAFTRAGDTLTITRAQKNTDAVAHTAGSRVQLCLDYSGDDPADILYDLLGTYAGISTSYLPLSSWRAETAAYLQRVYTALITEPTGVATLVSELIEQAALALWWDDSTQKVKLQVLREVSAAAKVFGDDNILEGSLQVEDQPDARVSQVHVYYGRRNPLRPLTDLDNYKQLYVNIDADNETDYGSASIVVVRSRWIPELGTSIANRMSDIILARFSNPPRRVSFDVMDTDDGIPELGAGHNIGSFVFQDDEGAAENVPVQIVSQRRGPAGARIDAEELRFGGIALDNPNDRVITVDANTDNIDLQVLHDTLYPAITDATGITLTVNIDAGVIVGSTDTATPAFDVGTWTDFPTTTLIVNGRIQGRGGKGGDHDNTGALSDGSDGGTALYTRLALDVENNGTIYGGGGGGAATASAPAGSNQAFGGGGGAGANPGLGGATKLGEPAASAGDDGTTEVGGDGGYYSVTRYGGDGGGFGAAGATAYAGGATAGAAGNAVDGVSYITFTIAGTRAGPEIN